MLNRREKILAIAVGVVCGAVLIQWRVVQPFLESRKKLAAEIAGSQQQLTLMKQAATRRDDTTKKWKQLIDDGLKSDQSAAHTQAVQTIEALAKKHKITVKFNNFVMFKPVKEFATVSIPFIAKGNESQLSEFLYMIETSKIPLRINSVQMTPDKPETRDLTAAVNVTTVAFIEQPKTPAKTGGK
jgi:hypothetical protein